MKTIEITATYGDIFLTTEWDRENGCVGERDSNAGQAKYELVALIDAHRNDINAWLDSVEWEYEPNEEGGSPYEYTKDDLLLQHDLEEDPPLIVGASRFE